MKEEKQQRSFNAQKSLVIGVSRGTDKRNKFEIRHSSSITWDRIHPNRIDTALIAREFLKKYDFDIYTEGNNIENCIEMAREAIAGTGLTYEDIGKEIPKAKYDNIPLSDDEILSLVDVDFDYFRNLENKKTVKKNCTVPQYIATLAETQKINFSEVLTNALKQNLGIE